MSCSTTVPSRLGVSFREGRANDFALMRLLVADSYDVVVDFTTWVLYAFENALLRMLGMLLAARDLVLVPCVCDVSRLLGFVQTAGSDRRYDADNKCAIEKVREEDMLRSSSASSWTCVRLEIIYSKERCSRHSRGRGIAVAGVWVS